MSRDPFKIDGPTWPSYAAMQANAEKQADAFGHDDEEALACFCGD